MLENGSRHSLYPAGIQGLLDRETEWEKSSVVEGANEGVVLSARKRRLQGRGEARIETDRTSRAFSRERHCDKCGRGSKAAPTMESSLTRYPFSAHPCSCSHLPEGFCSISQNSFLGFHLF